MNEVIPAFFSMYWHICLAVIVTMFLAIAIIVNWYEFRYWMMKIRLRLPGIGRIASWVKSPGDREQPSEENPNAIGFNNSERELCEAYQTYYIDHQPSEANFRRNQDYLAKIDEDGRREKGFGLWSLIIILMVIEASAFGFALAPFALTLATPNTALAGAFAIGLVISIIALFLSEFAGRQLYLNSVVGKIMSYENMRRGQDMIKTHNITIDNTHIDDDLPHFQQMLNRVKVPKDGEMPAKRFTVLIGYGIFITVLAVAAFWVRTETLNAQEAQLVENPPAVSQSADDFPVSGGAEDDFPMPSDMNSMSESVAGKSAQDQIDAMHRASLVTFAVLSVLFVFIQITSTFLAYMFGFAGTHSRKAWELTHKFGSAADFMRYHESRARSIAHDAQSSLGKLQSLQMNVFRANGEDREKLRSDMLSRTFKTFISEQETVSAHKSQKEKLAQLSKDGLAVVENYMKQTMEDLNAAIAARDNARIAEIIRVARPRFANATDPSLSAYQIQFKGVVDFFGATVEDPAPTAAAPAAPVVPHPPVQAASQPVVESAPAPAPPPFTEAVPVAAAPVPAAAPASSPAAETAFNHNAWGDLTAFEVDDMEYVAGKKGVDVALLQRARRLQLLDKQGA